MPSNPTTSGLCKCNRQVVFEITNYDLEDEYVRVFKLRCPECGWRGPERDSGFLVLASGVKFPSAPEADDAPSYHPPMRQQTRREELNEVWKMLHGPM